MQFQIANNVEQHQISSINSRFRPSTGNLERSLRDQGFSFSTVNSQDNPGCAEKIKSKTIHALDQIFFAGSRRSASVSFVTYTIGSCHCHPSCWVISASLQSYWKLVAESIAREHAKLSRQATHQAIQKHFVALLFIPAIPKQKKEGRSLSTDLLKRFSPT